MKLFGSISGQVARNSEPYMRQVFVTGDIGDEPQLARQVRRGGGERNTHRQTHTHHEYELAMNI